MKRQLVYTEKHIFSFNLFNATFTSNENRKTEIRLTSESCRRNHAKFLRASLLLLSMENCSKSPKCKLKVTWLNELDKC